MRRLLLVALLACNGDQASLGRGLTGAFDISFFKPSNYWPGDPQRRAWQSDGVAMHLDITQTSAPKSPITLGASLTPIFGAPIRLTTSVETSAVVLTGKIDACNSSVCDRWLRLQLFRTEDGYTGEVSADGEETGADGTAVVKGKAVLERDISPPAVRFKAPAPRVAWAPFDVEASEPVRVSSDDAPIAYVIDGPENVRVRALLKDWDTPRQILGLGLHDAVGNDAALAQYDALFTPVPAALRVDGEAVKPVMWGDAAIVQAPCKEGSCIELRSDRVCDQSSGIAARLRTHSGAVHVVAKLRVRAYAGTDKPWPPWRTYVHGKEVVAEWSKSAGEKWETSPWPYDKETGWVELTATMPEADVGMIVVPSCPLYAPFEAWSLLVEEISGD